MKRTYFLSCLVWVDGRNVPRCHSFHAATDAEARVQAHRFLASIPKRPSADGLKPDTGTTSHERMTCVSERKVGLWA